MNLSIPGDVSVARDDDWDWTVVLDPPVTVIAQSAYAMGKKAASLLISRFAQKAQISDAVTFIFKPELIIRNLAAKKRLLKLDSAQSFVII